MTTNAYAALKQIMENSTIEVLIVWIGMTFIVQHLEYNMRICQIVYYILIKY